MILNKKLENYWLILLSLPSWECGLKSPQVQSPLKILIVAPFVGVWIEIPEDSSTFLTGSVAPFVGVWIEMA